MPIVLGFIVCAAVTPVLARAAVAIGLVDRPAGGGLKIHLEPKPLSGGWAIVLAVLVAVIGTGVGLEPWSTAAILVLLAVGSIDDARGLSPSLRLGAQLLSGLLLALGGFTIEPLGWLGPIAVIVAVPALANAVNLTDGQDGLAAGLALVATAGLWFIDGMAADGEAVTLGLMGALLGFLVWNRPPASVFLGDGGAYAIGGLLVLIALRSSGSWESLLGSLVCLSVFLLELLTTVVRRASGSASLARGDREHLYDLLAGHVGGRTRATLAMWGVGALVAVLGGVVDHLPLVCGVAVSGAVAGIGVALSRILRRDPGTVLRRSR